MDWSDLGKSTRILGVKLGCLPQVVGMKVSWIER